MLITVFAVVIAAHMLPSQFAKAGELEDAIMAGNQARVETLLERGVQVNNRMDINGSPLHLAAAYGFVGIVKDLLAAGANLEAEDDPAGVHPLHVAADAGKADVLKLLLDHGAKVDARDREERTPLKMASAPGLCG